MDDCNSMQEAYTFAVLGRVPDKVKMPFKTFDAFHHSLSLQETGADLDADYVEMMQRFGKTFNGLHYPAGGGEVLFKPLMDTNEHE